MFRVAPVPLVLVLLLGSCSSDDGDDGGTSEPAVEDASGDTTDAEDGGEGGAEGSTIEVEDPNSDAVAVFCVMCIEPGFGNVTIELSGFSDVAGDLVEAEVRSQSTQVQVGADGTGIQIRQGNLEGPTAVIVELPSGDTLEGEVTGC
jgi:hypothetical protein